MHFSPYENLPVFDQAHPADVAAAMQRDFPLAFKFAQGNPGIQQRFNRLVAAAYVHTWTAEALDDVLPEAIPMAGTIVGRLRPPQNHVVVEDENRMKESMIQWERFAVALRGRALAGEMPESEFLHYAGKVNAPMQFSDTYHSFRGRPRARPGEAHHSSYYREYVLGEQQTSSPPFNIIFAAMRQRLLRRGPTWMTPFQQALWDCRHPEEAFYPESFYERLDESGSLFARASVALRRPTYYITRGAAAIAVPLARKLPRTKKP